MSETKGELPVETVCGVLRTEFDNIQRSLKCSICQGSYVDAVITTNCVHAFCRDCLLRALKSKAQCPICLTKCTRRSITDAPDLNKLVKLYKTATRHFGLAPSEYDPSIALTQAVDVPVLNPTRINQELQASRTFAKYSSPNELLRTEAQQIVNANQKTLLKTCQEPTNTQIDQECSEQLMTDEEFYYSANSLTEYPMPSQSNPSAAQKTSKVKAMVAALENRNTPSNRSPVKLGSPTPIIMNLRPDSPPTDDDDDDEMLQGPRVFKTYASPRRSSMGGPNVPVQATLTTESPSVAVAQPPQQSITKKKSPPIPKRLEEHATKPSPAERKAASSDAMEADDDIDGVDQDEEDRKPAAKDLPRATKEPVPSEPSMEEASLNKSRSNHDETSEGTAPGAASTTVATLSVDTEVPPQATSNLEAIEEGTTVEVQSRTWPGINQPGGVATVTKVHNIGGSVSYDVQYVLDRRKEKLVDAVFVKKQQLVESKERRRSPRDELSPALRARLKMQGFDVSGEETAKVLAKLQGDSKENSLPSKKTAAKKMTSVGRSVPNPPQSATKKRKSPQGKRPLKRLKSPKSSNETLCRQADKQYQYKIEQAIQKGTVVLSTSFLPPESEILLKDLSKIVRSTNVRISVSESIHPTKTTICLLPVGKRTETNVEASNRSMKAMLAALHGVPIVAAAHWINLCLTEGKIVLPTSDMYIRSLPLKKPIETGTSAFGVAKLATQETPFLAGGKVYLCGFSSKKEKEFSGLLFAAGVEEVLTNVAQLKSVSKAFVICDAPIVSEALVRAVEKNPKNILVVNSAWVVDSVSCATPLPSCSKAYKPVGVKGARLWSLTNGNKF